MHAQVFALYSLPVRRRTFSKKLKELFFELLGAIIHLIILLQL